MIQEKFSKKYLNETLEGILREINERFSDDILGIIGNKSPNEFRKKFLKKKREKSERMPVKKSWEKSVKEFRKESSKEILK